MSGTKNCASSHGTDRPTPSPGGPSSWQIRELTTVIAAAVLGALRCWARATQFTVDRLEPVTIYPRPGVLMPCDDCLRQVLVLQIRA